MVILLKQHAPQAEQERLLSWLRELGAEVRITGTPERPFFCHDDSVRVHLMIPLDSIRR